VIFFVTPARADWTVREYLSKWGLPVADRIRIRHYEDFLAASAFERGTYVLSGLCGLTPGGRDRLQELMERLTREGGFRFLNHPARSLRRLGLLEELSRRGLNAFRAVRATADFERLRYPVFLRSEMTHDGALSSLLRSPHDVEAAIGRSLLRGRLLKDLLVVEFVDTADAAGNYRKYSAFVVGDRVLPRSLEIGRNWMLKHSRSEFTLPIMEEERAYMVGNPHGAELARIFAAARIEYGRIDYAIADGRLCTWEINLHPTIGRGPGPSKGLIPKDLLPYREETKSFFYHGFAEAWADVDLPSAGAPATISASDACSRAASDLVDPAPLDGSRRPAWWPVRRFAEAAAAAFLPVVGRRAVARARRSD